MITRDVIKIFAALLLALVVVASATAQVLTRPHLDWMRQAALTSQQSEQPVTGSWNDTNSYAILMESEVQTASYVQDSSGSGRHFSNSPSLWPTQIVVGTNELGRVEHAYNFTNGAFLFVPGNSRSCFNDTVTSLVVFAWVYPTSSVPNWAGVISEWTVKGYNGFTFTGNKPNALVGNSSGSKWVNIVGALTIPMNEWTFISMFWVVNTSLSVFHNMDTNAGGGGTYPTSASSWEGTCIGRNGVGSIDFGGGQTYFPGYIDGAGIMTNMTWLTGEDDATKFNQFTNVIGTIMNNTHPTNNLRIR